MVHAYLLAPRALVSALSLLTLLPLPSIRAVPTQPTTTSAQLATLPMAGARYSLPLAFEPNKGQADPGVRFLAHGPGYTLFLTEAGAVFSLHASQPRSSQSLQLGPLHAFQVSTRAAQPAAATTIRTAIVRLSLAGASPRPRLIGAGRLPGVVSYFIGNDPHRWHGGIPIYMRVVYRDVYPGIDEVFSGSGGRLAFGFVLHPGATPAAIALATSGGAISVDARGGIALHTSLGSLVQAAPLLYSQRPDGLTPVAGHYQLAGRSMVRLALAPAAAAPAASAPPVLSYATYVGGVGGSAAGAIAVDGAAGVPNTVYITRETASTAFPATPGALQGTNRGGRSYFGSWQGDVFIARLNATGTALVYATYLGGSNGEEGEGIAVDAAGNAYVAGVTSSPDFPVTTDAPQRAYRGTYFSNNAFVAKVNATGSALLYSTFLGGSGDGGDWGRGIAVDAAGNAYVTGYANSRDFPVTPGVVQGKLATVGGAFVAKINPAGTALLYSTFLGDASSHNDDERTYGAAIAIDTAGNAYVTGQTGGDFPVTADALQHTNGGATAAFVAKLNATGSMLIFSTYLGAAAGSWGTRGAGIAVDALGNTDITGQTDSRHFPVTPGALQRTYGGGGAQGDAFVAKLNATGSALLCATYLGGKDDDWGTAIALDPADNI